MKEILYLRCVRCNYVFLATVDTNDKIYEIGCPHCNKKSVELDLGHKVSENQKKFFHFKYDTNEKDFIGRKW